MAKHGDHVEITDECVLGFLTTVSERPVAPPAGWVEIEAPWWRRAQRWLRREPYTQVFVPAGQE